MHLDSQKKKNKKIKKGQCIQLMGSLSCEAEAIESADNNTAF